MATTHDITAEARRRIAAVRRADPASAPSWATAMPDRLAELLRQRHLEADGPVWGTARRDPDQALPFDEHGSGFFLRTVKTFDLWDELGWRPHMRDEVVRYWQSWQDPRTGRFVDARDPERGVNEKYIVGLLQDLEAEPLYPHSTTSDHGAIEVESLLQRTADDPDWDTGGWHVGSGTAFQCREVLEAVHHGRTELIPGLEQAMNNILGHQAAEDGLWGPPDAPLAGRIGGTLKVVGRFYFQMGVPLPRADVLAQTLVRHQERGDWFACSTNICIPRNVAEVLAFCLEQHGSPRGDIHEAMESVASDPGKRGRVR